jgi:hypothetical protein
MVTNSVEAIHHLQQVVGRLVEGIERERALEHRSLRFHPGPQQVHPQRRQRADIIGIEVNACYSAQRRPEAIIRCGQVAGHAVGVTEARIDLERRGNFGLEVFLPILDDAWSRSTRAYRTDRLIALPSQWTPWPPRDRLIELHPPTQVRLDDSRSSESVLMLSSRRRVLIEIAGKVELRRDPRLVGRQRPRTTSRPRRGCALKKELSQPV